MYHALFPDPEHEIYKNTRMRKPRGEKDINQVKAAAKAAGKSDEEIQALMTKLASGEMSVDRILALLGVRRNRSIKIDMVNVNDRELLDTTKTLIGNGIAVRNECLDLNIENAHKGGKITDSEAVRIALRVLNALLERRIYRP